MRKGLGCQVVWLCRLELLTNFWRRLVFRWWDLDKQSDSRLGKMNM